MGIEIILFMGVLVVGMFVMNSFAKKSQKKRQEEQERTMKEQMVPGAWVQTYSGFFGRFVDTDGDVVILETPSGEETYWIRAAIRAVTDPPFEEVSDEVSVDLIEAAEPGASSDYDFDRAEEELSEAAPESEEATAVISGDDAIVVVEEDDDEAKKTDDSDKK